MLRLKEENRGTSKQTQTLSRSLPLTVSQTMHFVVWSVISNRHMHLPAPPVGGQAEEEGRDGEVQPVRAGVQLPGPALPHDQSGQHAQESAAGLPGTTPL